MYSHFPIPLSFIVVLKNGQKGLSLLVEAYIIGGIFTKHGFRIC